MSAEQVIDLNFRPHRFQRDVASCLDRFVVMPCHRRFGKTEFAVHCLVDRSIRNPRDGAKNKKQYAYIAPKLNQAKRVAWNKFKAIALAIPGAVVKERELYIEFPWDSVLYLIGADANADSMRGMYFDGVIVDEIGDIDEHVWTEVIRPTLADYNGWAIFIGTPKGPNLFYELKKRGDGKEPGWRTFTFRESDTRGCDDMPWLPDGERELMAREMGGRESKKWKREMECDFEVSADDALIPVEAAVAALDRFCKKEDVQFEPVVLGIDTARDGGDPSVICVRQGRLVLEFEEMRIPDNMVLADAIASRIQKLSPDGVFIDMGSGQGVVDRLRQLGFTVHGVFFGAAPMDPQRYANRRAEMWDRIRKALVDDGLCLPRFVPGLAEELAAPSCWKTGSDKLQLEPKKDIRERLGRSTDKADALALTFAAPVARQGSRGKHGQRFAKSDYNVLGD